MKRPIFLTLIGIGVALLVVGVVFVVPWSGQVFNEMETITELHHQLIRALEASAHEPLTAEQEKLLAQLLEIAAGTDISENPNDLERVLSSEPYLIPFLIVYIALAASMKCEKPVSLAISVSE